jgi:hypothetical protein
MLKKGTKKMIEKDISTEKWRCYEWIIPETGETRRRIIHNPLKLFYEKGSSCHVVVYKDDDLGVTSICVPSVGRWGCVLTWQGKEDAADVTFVSASKEDSKK